MSSDRVGLSRSWFMTNSSSIRRRSLIRSIFRSLSRHLVEGKTAGTVCSGTQLRDRVSYAFTCSAMCLLPCHTLRLVQPSAISIIIAYPTHPDRWFFLVLKTFAPNHSSKHRLTLLCRIGTLLVLLSNSCRQRWLPLLLLVRNRTRQRHERLREIVR